MLKNSSQTILMLILLFLLTITGCESPDDRLARLAEVTSRAQAQQNERLAEQHHEITKTSRALVEADAKSRAEFYELTRDLQTERLGLNQQRELVDQEREQLALARIRDPLKPVPFLSWAFLQCVYCRCWSASMYCARSRPGTPKTERSRSATSWFWT